MDRHPVQGIPVLMLLFLSYYGLSMAGFDMPPIFAASVSMALYASAYLGEIWRGCIQAVPWQQWEASTALAFSRAQQYRYVILPQAMRIAVPPTVGFLVQLVKNTSIVSIIGVVELARAGQPGQQRHLPALQGLRDGGARSTSPSAGRSRCWPGAWKGSSMPVVQVEGVHKSFGAVEVLKGIHLTVETGRGVAIIGRSGSGK